jgi:DNA-directed RNA polymerase specialized sigma24 family protein
MTTVHDQAASRASHEKTLSVKELLQAASGGSSSAWDEIVYRYHSLVWVKVRSFRLPYTDACDAAQTTWLRLAESCHKIPHPDHLGRWLVTTAHRECLRILQRPTHPSGSAETVVDLPGPAVSPGQRDIDADAAQRLRIRLGELPPRWRSLLPELFTDQP